MSLPSFDRVSQLDELAVLDRVTSLSLLHLGVHLALGQHVLAETTELGLHRGTVAVLPVVDLLKSAGGGVGRSWWRGMRAAGEARFVREMLSPPKAQTCARAAVAAVRTSR